MFVVLRSCWSAVTAVFSQGAGVRCAQNLRTVARRKTSVAWHVVLCLSGRKLVSVARVFDDIYIYIFRSGANAEVVGQLASCQAVCFTALTAWGGETHAKARVGAIRA